MTTVEVKSQIHSVIDGIEDINILEAINVLLAVFAPKVEDEEEEKEEESDWWDELPEEVTEGIEEAIEQADRGELIPHEQVMSEVKEKYLGI